MTERKQLRFEDNPVFVRFGKVIVFLLLVVVGVIVAVNNWRRSVFGVAAWFVVVPTISALVIENAIKTWALKSYKPKIACYVIDILALMTLTIFTDAALISTLYIVILSEFYLESKSLAASIAMCVSSIVLFLITMAVSGVVTDRETILDIGDVFSIIANALNDIILIALHFLVINFSIEIYRKSRALNAKNEELAKSNERLMRAYEELKEVTALEERQRIAKDIHDTAGHSITTVIMQTEAAKLVLEENPEEAKRRIAAANLQAKHALEELRESVHLLSGNSELLTLKDMLLNIIHDSTDGTDIAVRYSIDDVRLCDAKQRFICKTLKEGISNGLRHGNASAFWFELKRERDPDRISFLLSDNGTGLNLASLKEGFGLTGMHRRAESLGGNVWFETEPDEGFEIHMTLPPDGGAGGSYEN